MPDRRFLIPLIAAFAIAMICAWRIVTNKPQDYADQVAAAIVTRPAPGFEALDADNHLVRLRTFLGRHQIIVLFFDGDVGAAKDPELLRLRERFEELQARGVKVFAISNAIPQRNRAAMEQVGKFPFPLISDFDPLAPEGLLRIHRQWGRLDPQSGKPLTGVFLVDRMGQISFNVDGPRPMENVDAAVSAALR